MVNQFTEEERENVREERHVRMARIHTSRIQEQREAPCETAQYKHITARYIVSLKEMFCRPPIEIFDFCSCIKSLFSLYVLS